MPLPKTAVVVAGVVAAVFVSSPLHTPLNNPNEGVRVFTVEALVEHHTFAIDDVTRAWGFIDDKAVCGEQRDHKCASKAPLVSLVAASFYAVVHPVTGDLSRATLTRFCRVTGGVLPAALALGVLWWALRRRSRSRSGNTVVVDVVVVASVVGSGVLASLNVFSGHALAALAPAAVLALGLLDEEPGPARLALASMLLTAAACAEYPAALAMPLLLLLLLRARDKQRALLVVVVAGFATALPTLIAHTLMFGAPWRTGYSSLDNPQYQPLVEGTFFGIALPDPRVLVTVLFSPAVGLFFFSPLLLAGLLGVRHLDKRARAVVVAIVCAFCFFIAGFKGWRGGWSVGPRYISELIGILSVLAVLALENARHGKAIAFAGAGAGVVCSGVAGAFFPHLPDVLHNPVGELAIPLVVRGLCPDAIPLALGVPAAGVVVVCCLFLPLVLIALVHKERSGLALVVVVPFTLAVSAVHLTDERVKAKEARRMLDNWQPEAGVPYLVDAGAEQDPRVLYAIDRGRLAKSPTCDFAAPRPRRLDVPGGAVLQRVNAPLVIVDDALADHLAPAGGAPLFVTVSDLERHLRALPCSGDVITVLRPGTPLPKKVQKLKQAEQHTDDGFVVTRFSR